MKGKKTKHHKNPQTRNPSTTTITTTTTTTAAAHTAEEERQRKKDVTNLRRAELSHLEILTRKRARGLVIGVVG